MRDYCALCGVQLHGRVKVERSGTQVLFCTRALREGAPPPPPNCAAMLCGTLTALRAPYACDVVRAPAACRATAKTARAACPPPPARARKLVSPCIKLNICTRPNSCFHVAVNASCWVAECKRANANAAGSCAVERAAKQNMCLKEARTYIYEVY